MVNEVEVGKVAELWRFPVKSMRGERLATADVVAEGLVGDRGYALVDEETGKVVSAVNVRRYPNLFAFRARYLESPKPNGPLPAVQVELPDGQEISSDDADVHRAISQRLGVPVRLVRAGEATAGPHHDASPISVLSNSTLRRMNELQPGSRYDSRRFRMNMILDCEEPGFPENDWVGRSLRMGSMVGLAITRPDARCIMTTLPQEDLPDDPRILRGLVRHNRLRVGGKGPYPCAGVYADVRSQGRLAVGDPVRLDGG